MQSIIELLTKRKETISTMESCTGGALASAITDVEGSSAVFEFSAVTYSNDYKRKMGVSSHTIDCYSVYSEEVAKEMSKQISLFTNSTYGIGITGKINREDPHNAYGENNVVFISIYQRDFDCYFTEKLELPLLKREECKKKIIEEIEKRMFSILKEKENR